MEDIIVSVCISVYNGEKFLRRCLESVIAQKIDPLEMVLVNDGSTDLTLLIMNEFKERYPNVKVISQENRGLAQGRLTGVKNAVGRYITFLDADDYLLDGAYQTILKYMENTKADIYEFRTVRDDYFSGSPYQGVMNSKKVLVDYFNGESIPVNYWLRWFKRELFTEKIFPGKISLYEDVYAFPCLLYRADTIAYIKKPLHVHTKNRESIMNRFHETKNTIDYFEKQKTLLSSVPHIVSNIGKNVIEKEYKKPFAHYMSRIYRNFVLMDIDRVPYNERIDAIINTLKLNRSGRRVEWFIEHNLPIRGKTNCAIRILGLHNTYRLFWLARKMRLKT